ncbi:MAG: GIY-YIG nuclease family protein [Spirochaetaceae bacterium]|nr:GIY-YIG nuclease family protein [Spirochaetaceae bacterium]
MKSDKVEFVYLLTNPAMPGFIKVGITKNIESRIKNLSSKTAVPKQFQCHSFLTVKGDKPSAADIEKALHFFLKQKYDKSKEYFEVSIEEAVSFFEYVSVINPRIKYSLYKKDVKEKSKPTTFEMLDIPVGAELVYVTDSSVRCTVVNNKNSVLFNGKETTVSWIACDKENRSVNGYERFVYPASEFPEETLWERRCRLSLSGK